MQWIIKSANGAWIRLNNTTGISPENYGIKLFWKLKAQVCNIITFIEELPYSYCFGGDNITTNVKQPSFAAHGLTPFWHYGTGASLTVPSLGVMSLKEKIVSQCHVSSHREQALHSGTSGSSREWWDWFTCRPMSELLTYLGRFVCMAIWKSAIHILGTSCIGPNSFGLSTATIQSRQITEKNDPGWNSIAKCTMCFKPSKMSVAFPFYPQLSLNAQIHTSFTSLSNHMVFTVSTVGTRISLNCFSWSWTYSGTIHFHATQHWFLSSK